MTKRRIVIFEECSRDYIIKRMVDFSFNPPIGLVPNTESGVDVGSYIELPSSTTGKLVAKRRNVVWFWRWEYLIESKTEQGTFYEWFPQHKIKVL